MNLHRANRPDWQGLKPGEMNRWQQAAARSGGWVTPGNFISLAGLIIVMIGLGLLVNHATIVAAILILVGRAADLADGFVADKTGTKSPIGEGVDAGIDKVQMGLAIIALFVADADARWFAVLVLLHFVYNIGAFTMSRRRNFRLHPSAVGKLTAVALWIGTSLYILAAAKVHTSFGDAAIWSADACMVIFGILAIACAVQYTKQIRQG